MKSKILFKVTEQSGSVQVEDGAIISSSTYVPTEYIDVSSYFVIEYKRIGATFINPPFGMVFYNADKNAISGYPALGSQSSGGYLQDYVTALVPVGAKYARFTTYIDTDAKGSFEIYGLGVSGELYNTILCNCYKKTPTTALFARGAIINGSNSSATNRIRTIKRIHPSVVRIDSPIYPMVVIVYNKENDAYLGTLRTNGIIDKEIKTYGQAATYYTLDVANLFSAYPNCYFRLTFRATDDRDIDVDIASTITFYTSPVKESGVVDLSRRITNTVSEYYELFEQFVTDGFCTKTLIATVQGLPIYRYDFTGMDGWVDQGSYTIVTDRRLFNKYNILLTSGMHGDEKNATIGLYEAIKNICYNPSYAKYLALCDFHVVPICNPTGYNLNTRNNYQDININRIDESYETVECIAVQSVIDSGIYDMYFDFHTMRTDSMTYRQGEVGIVSFAIGTPEDLLLKEYRAVMEAGAKTEQAIRNQFCMQSNNNMQNFYPWKAQNVQSFKNYGLLHEVFDIEHGNTLVGSPISATFECSDTCYSFSKSSVDNNVTAQWICTTFLDNVLRCFLDKILDGKFN